MKDKYLERALFVVAGRHCGKSTQLRSMFRDVRLGTGGEIPKGLKLREWYRLTNERSLYLRLSSPHELKESLTGFLKKTHEKMTAATPKHGRRWNFACALHPYPLNKMPDVVTACEAFVARFVPERTRVVFLNPDRKGNFIEPSEIARMSRRLRRIPSVEVCWIDARSEQANGLQLMDFFAF